MTNAADGMLYLLRENPSLLPPAPVDFDAETMEHRRHDAVQMCLRCGKQARCVIVAGTSLGPRWLDLCFGCTNWLRTNVT